MAKMNVCHVFFLVFSLQDRCRFFEFFDRLFGDGLLSSSVLLSFEDLLRLLGLYILECSFRGSPTLGKTSLLLCPWSLFYLIREGLFSQSLELISLPDIMLDLCFKTEEAFIYWFNFTVILWWQRKSLILNYRLNLDTLPLIEIKIKRRRETGPLSDID